MTSVPHNTSACFVLDFSGSSQAATIKFDRDFKFLNLTVRRDGFIQWMYDSSNLENYNFKFKIALAGLNGGGSINLNFWLEEVIPTAEIPIDGYPVGKFLTEFKEDTFLSIRHIAHKSTLLGGLVYELEMKLDQQRVQMPRISDQRVRWYRLRVSTRAPLSCAASDSRLSGFRVPIESNDHGMLPGNEYSTVYFPFLSMYIEKASTSLLDTDLTSMQIVSFNDLAQFKGELIDEINIESTDINTALLELIDSTVGDVATVDEVRTALITDLGDDTSEFSVAILDLVTGTPDFSVSPTSGSIISGTTKDFTVSVTGGLNIATIEVSSSDTGKATVAISGNLITVTGVAVGSATIMVASSDIAKTIALSITVQDDPDFSVSSRFA